MLAADQGDEQAQWSMLDWSGMKKELTKGSSLSDSPDDKLQQCVGMKGKSDAFLNKLLQTEDLFG